MSDISRTPVILEADHLKVTFRVGHRRLAAVDDVSLVVRTGETVALVGESGSGKSTVALTLMRAHESEAGSIIFEGRDITRLTERQLRPIRRRLQMIFQNPYASLDPRMTVAELLTEPMAFHRIGTKDEIRERVALLLEQVGLAPSAARRHPSQFSGGQRQRISIARALALSPSMLIADEPVSALDVSVQAQVVQLLADIQEKEHLAYLVIAHDLALVHQISDRVIVMYLGAVVEEGETVELIERPLHPYTAALISATPVPDGPRRERIILTGEPPSALDRPTGCAFHPRCPIARDRCRKESPPLELVEGRRVACFYPGEVTIDLAHR
jgi:oligopeptide/dipeptide ABC transporter ATP-binding protein